MIRPFPVRPVNDSAEAGMVKVATLKVGDEFTFHSRRGQYRLVLLPDWDARNNFGTYEPVNDAARETTPGRTVATRNWWVWPAEKES